MLFPTLSPQRAAIFISLLLFISLKTCATAVERRSDCCIGQCEDDDNGNQALTLDGPTSDRSPGIGVEFETSAIVFQSQNCDKSSTDKSKGAMVGTDKVIIGSSRRIHHPILQGGLWQSTSWTVRRSSSGPAMQQRQPLRSRMIL